MFTEPLALMLPVFKLLLGLSTYTFSELVTLNEELSPVTFNLSEASSVPIFPEALLSVTLPDEVMPTTELSV